ncbi:MAG: hypothetical protein HZA31_06120 [Opitutae bacterium]|nr:hypothetical protein [Opitutae bacterium]
MTTRFAFTLLAAMLALAGSACRSSKTPKPSSAVATEVEAGFKQRWIDKRTAELTATGKSADEARTQADKEFRDNYSYLRAPANGRR